MVEYGYIENGYLISKILKPEIENYKDEETGYIKTKTISIKEQIDQLGSIWKPVAPIDEDKRKCEDGYIIRLVPYDAADHIDYEYQKVLDVQKVRKDIAVQREFLDSTDYQITKCNEAFMLGDPLPYDLKALHIERQTARDKINELETILNQAK